MRMVQAERSELTEREPDPNKRTNKRNAEAGRADAKERVCGTGRESAQHIGPGNTAHPSKRALRAQPGWREFNPVPKTNKVAAAWTQQPDPQP